MNSRQAAKLDDLPEVGPRAAWHETEADWRSFLLSTSAPGWNVGWLRLVLDEKATKLALKFFYHPDGFVLPPMRRRPSFSRQRPSARSTWGSPTSSPPSDLTDHG